MVQCHRMTTALVHDAAELGLLVRETRLQQGLSQTELAIDARVGRQWLVGFEAGDKASAPLDMVLRLLQALRLDVTLSGSPAPTALSVEAPFTPRASDVLARYERP